MNLHIYRCINIYNHMCVCIYIYIGFPGGSVVNNLPGNTGEQEVHVLTLGQEDTLEKELATHSPILPG